MLKTLSSFFLALFTFQVLAFYAEYPKAPDARLTPGKLCELRVKYRYAERIPYCDRDVFPETKESVYIDYRRLGYNLNRQNRADYKIDHFFPLCAGGSNHPTNLWPQHVSIFTQTDPLEYLVCEKMKEGRLRQREALDMIKKGKHNLSQIPSILHYLENLR